MAPTYSASLLAKINQSLAIPSDGFLTAEVLSGLRRFYAADFARFGFPEREAAPVPQRRAAEFVNDWTDRIFDRNRMLAEHVRNAHTSLGRRLFRRFWQRKPWRHYWMPRILESLPTLGALSAYGDIARAVQRLRGKHPSRVK